ncbi:glycosyltransferase [Carnobacterium divergens]|uniref:glycosyltransferase n=1 Tax=Carnobacterium divergens TaxID=2748 RepID=UPI0039AF4E0B
MKVLVMTRLPEVDASSRQRVYQYKEILEKEHGIYLTVVPFYSKEIFLKYRQGKLSKMTLAKLLLTRRKELKQFKDFDLVWILRSLSPLENPNFLKKITKKKIPVIFEMDDAIYLGEKANRLRTKITRSWNHVEKYVSNSNAIIVGNEELKTWSLQYNKNVVVIPTGLDIGSYPKKKHIANDKFTIGWIGSESTAPNLDLVIPAINEFSKNKNIRVVFIGLGNYSSKVKFHEDIEFINLEWSEEIQRNYLQKFDIGIAPLYNTPFNRGKCAYKVIQYMATGIPTVGSPVGVQKELFSSNEIGFSANDQEEWISMFNLLLNDNNLRLQLGKNSRMVAENNFDVAILANKIATVMKNIFEEKDKSHENT